MSDYTEFRSKTVRVRKDQKCAWCPEAIIKGESAVRRVYFFEELQRDWMHPECHAAMERIPFTELLDGFEPQSFARGSTDERP